MAITRHAPTTATRLVALALSSDQEADCQSDAIDCRGASSHAAPPIAPMSPRPGDCRHAPVGPWPTHRVCHPRSPVGITATGRVACSTTEATTEPNKTSEAAPPWWDPTITMFMRSHIGSEHASELVRADSTSGRMAVGEGAICPDRGCPSARTSWRRN